MKHNLTANSIQSNDDTAISVRSELERDEAVSIEDISQETLVTRRQVGEVIANVPVPYIDFVNPGDNIPKSFSLPERFNNRFDIKFEILLPVSGGAYFSDTNGATITYQTLWVDNTYTLVNRVDIYGAPDGSGKFADKFMFTVYAL